MDNKKVVKKNTPSPYSNSTHSDCIGCSRSKANNSKHYFDYRPVPGPGGRSNKGQPQLTIDLEGSGACCRPPDAHHPAPRSVLSVHEGTWLGAHLEQGAGPSLWPGNVGEVVHNVT